MSTPFQTKRHLRHALAAWLILAVVFAQWMGMNHRIAHADRLMGSSPSVMQLAALSVTDTVIKGSVDGSANEHSCAAFDAATVADTLYIPFTCAGTLPSQALVALWSAFASWDAPFLRFFSSRAPPLA